MTAEPLRLDLLTATADDPAAGRAIHGDGTPDHEWMAWPPVGQATACGLDTLCRPLERLVVLAPHPDDELLACGGLIALHAARGGAVRIVAATDGEASHGTHDPEAVRALADGRRAERLLGLARLVPQPAEFVDVASLGLPDGGLAQRLPALRRRLAAQVAPGDVVVTTWRTDGHPDHEACGEAAAIVCREAGLRLIEAPVWMWHWSRPGDARVPWHRLVRLTLGDAVVERKRDAVRAHTSQLEPRRTPGAAPLPPVIVPTALERVSRRAEFYLV